MKTLSVIFGASAVVIAIGLLINESSLAASTVFVDCGTDSLMRRHQACDPTNPKKGDKVPKGCIVLWDGRKSSDGSGVAFKANRLEADAVAACFDRWESIPGVVTYKSTGKYPNYLQKVIRGGCEHDELNCSD